MPHGERIIGYLVVTVKSSNWVTESALVHTPTLPARLKVVSSTSYSLLPLKCTSKRGPAATTLNVLQCPDRTCAFLPDVRPSPLTGRSVRLPFSTLYSTTLFSSAFARTM